MVLLLSVDKLTINKHQSIFLWFIEISTTDLKCFVNIPHTNNTMEIWYVWKWVWFALYRCCQPCLNLSLIRASHGSLKSLKWAVYFKNVYCLKWASYSLENYSVARTIMITKILYIRHRVLGNIYMRGYN